MVADLRGHHHGEDARQVCLIRQRNKIEHQVEVLVEGVGNAGRGVGQIQLRQITLFHLLNAPLDLANGFEIVIEHDAVFGAHARLEAGGLPARSRRECWHIALPSLARSSGVSP